MLFLDKMVNKKGSHVSIIVSMVLFIGFVIFLYFISQPVFMTRTDKQVVMDYLEIKLKQEIVSPVNILSISINNSYSLPEGSGSCVYISNPYSNRDFIVKDFDNNVIDSKQNSGNAEFAFSSNRNFKIYFFNSTFEHNLGEVGCGSLSGSDYSINSNLTMDLVSLDAVNNLINIYEGAYSELMTYLSIPLNNDFSFKFIYSNGTIIGPEFNDKNLNIFVKDFPIRYLDIDGSQKQGILQIIVW